MKITRKFLIIALCTLLLVAFSSTTYAEESEFSGIVSKNIEVTETDDVEVLIDIAGNPGIMALILEVSYDSEVLTLKENGFTDTGLLVGNVETTITRNPFRLGWQHSDATSVNNYKNGNIAKLAFEMKDGFIGTTNVEVKVVEAQTFGEDYVFRLVPMESGVISVTRPKLAIKDGVAIANSVDGETLIIASYDENRMVDCKVYPNVAGDVKLTIADEINTTGATKVKAFLWKDLETCMPVCNHAEEELNITDIN